MREFTGKPGCGIDHATYAQYFFGLGVALPAAALIWLSFIGCNTVLAIAAICVCVATNAFIYSGMYVSTCLKMSTNMYENRRIGCVIPRCKLHLTFFDIMYIILT